MKPVNQKLDAQGRKLDILWDQVEKVTVGLEDVKETLDLHTDALKRIEVENHLGIVPPPELNIIR